MPHASWKRDARSLAPARRYIAPLRRLLEHLVPSRSVSRIGQRPDAMEPRLRHVVAEQLGVDTGELTADVSLTEDLAADSLDLVELAVAIEDEFPLTVPESMLTEIRTYGELVTATRTLMQEQNAPDPSTEVPAYVSAHILPARQQASGDRYHGGWLTPYTAQAIVDDVLGEGPGARLEVTVPSNISSLRFARLLDQFAPLGQRGVQVSVRRDDPPAEDHPGAAA